MIIQYLRQSSVQKGGRLEQTLLWWALEVCHSLEHLDVVSGTLG